MDSHNTSRVVIDGMVKNEGDVQVGGFPPYPISYRSLIPKSSECKNLFVPVCLSATHIAYGSIRMEPVFMVLGQSTATAAVQAIDRKVSVQAVDVKAVQNRLKEDPLADGSTPEILVDNDDKDFVTIQGEWNKEINGGYAFSYLQSSTVPGNATQSVKFSPAVKKAGKPSLGKSKALPVRLEISSTATALVKKLRLPCCHRPLKMTGHNLFKARDLRQIHSRIKNNFLL